MKKLALLFAVLPGLALAQIGASASVHVDLPVVLPPLVVVQPGIRVVPDVDAEVFYTNGFYWIREDGGWYRSRNHRGGWVFVEPRHVPPGLVRIPPGQYKKWHRPAPAAYRGAPRPAGYRGAPAPAPSYRVRGGGDDHGRLKGGGHGKHGRD